MTKTKRKKRVQQDTTNTGRPRGDLQNRIIRAVARTRVEGTSRKALLNEFDKADRSAAARLVGRLIQRDLLQDRVVLNGPTVGLTGRGMVGIVLDLLDRRKVNHKRTLGKPIVCPRCDHVYEARPKRPAFRQEDIVEAIVVATRLFTEKLDDIQIVLLDAKIVHGASFNILLTLLYRHEDDLMKYVRNVIQNVKFVRDTETMLIPYSRAYATQLHGDADLWPELYTPLPVTP